MPDKKQIKNSIDEIARQLGRTPSLSEFVARSGITKHAVLRFFPRWNDAIRATGLEPGRLKVRPEGIELLKDWGQMVRMRRALPTKYAYRREGRYDPRTLQDRFGGWSSVPRAFRNFARGKREWADVLALLPAPVAHAFSSKPVRGVVGARDTRARQTYESSLSSIPPKPLQHPPLKGRATYGNPTNFLALRHEPVNEQGVVLLFGMLANDLGYRIEAVQKGFPDCEAIRQVAPERWQRVHIEFEFESRNFLDHGHPLTGCDVIVCWRHNWDDCPDHIEVLELESLVPGLNFPDRDIRSQNST